MSRIARVSVAGIPYHITQRGNYRQVVFTDAQDHQTYLNLLRRYREEHGLRIWSWCLMSNHVHLLAVPRTAESLARALGCTHRDYARYRNVRVATCGHFWQARYYSCPVEERGLWAVMAYIERNPVRAGMVASAEEYRWSSARAHVTGRDEDGWLDMRHWREEYTSVRWVEVLRDGIEEEAFRERLRVSTRTGRPMGSDNFVDDIERAVNRTLRPREPGRPKKTGDSIRDPGFPLLEIGD
jgi:putative transposase